MAEVRGGLHYPRSIGEFQAWFRTDADCLDYLEWLRWPHGFECAKCDGVGGWRTGDRRIMCAACGHRTSVTAGTIFDKTRTPLTVWFTACWSFATAKDGISALSLQRSSLEIGSYQTAWAMLARFRSVLVRPGRERLNGTVEVDETYIGGEEPGLAGGRAQGKKVLTGIAVEVSEPKGIGRCRMALLEDGAAAAWSSTVCSSLRPVTSRCATATSLPGTSHGRPHQCRLLRAGIRRASTESPPGVRGALRICHTPAKWRAQWEHMRVRPGDLDVGGLGELVQAAGGSVPVHPGTAAVEQDRPARARSGRPVGGPAGGPADCRRQRDQDGLWCPCRTRAAPGGRALRRDLRCPLQWPRRSASPAGRAWPPARSRTGPAIPGRR